MRAIVAVLVLCFAPFVLGALVLWLIERKKRSTRPLSADALGFLVRDLGFSGPVVQWQSRELHETYSRDAVVVDAFWDGAPTPVVGIHVGAKSAVIWHLELPAVAGLLQAHPEILDGDFTAIERQAKP